MRWDWYQATIRGVEPWHMAATINAACDLSDIKPGRAKNGYEHAWDIRRGDRVLASVWWGGNPGVHVLATGENAPTVAEVIDKGRKCEGWDVSPTRVDACVDWVQPGLFDQLSSLLIAFAKDAGIKIDQRGDWQRGEARTLYLGSRRSTYQLVLYEKGYESGGDKNWVRLEARVYPLKPSRAAVAKWWPADAFRGSPWAVCALEAIGWGKLEPLAVGSVWRPSDAQRARAALLRQYGAIMSTWAEEVGGWSAMGEAIGWALQPEADNA
jgi:hypothetical protein